MGKGNPRTLPWMDKQLINSWWHFFLACGAWELWEEVVLSGHIWPMVHTSGYWKKMLCLRGSFFPQQKESSSRFISSVHFCSLPLHSFTSNLVIRSPFIKLDVFSAWVILGVVSSPLRRAVCSLIAWLSPTSWPIKLMFPIYRLDCDFYCLCHCCNHQDPPFNNRVIGWIRLPVCVCVCVWGETDRQTDKQKALLHHYVMF